MVPYLAKALCETGHELTQGLSSCRMENQFWSGLDGPKTVLWSKLRRLKTSNQRAEDSKTFYFSPSFSLVCRLRQVWRTPASIPPSMLYGTSNILVGMLGFQSHLG